MAHGSHIANIPARQKFANSVTTRARRGGDSSHMRNISKAEPLPPRWFAKEWLKAKGVKQAQVVAASGRTKSEVSEWV